MHVGEETIVWDHSLVDERNLEASQERTKYDLIEESKLFALLMSLYQMQSLLAFLEVLKYVPYKRTLSDLKLSVSTLLISFYCGKI